MADDATPIDEGAGGVYPYPGTPSWANQEPAGAPGWPPPPPPPGGVGGWSGPWHPPAPGYPPPGGWPPVHGAGPWQPAGPPSQRHRRLRATLATLVVLAVAALGVLIGYTAAPSASRPAAAAGSPGSGSSGSTPSGSSPSGSNPYFDYPGSGSGSSGLGGNSGGGNSGGGSVSTASGGPSDVAAIAKKVDAGLVDVNTTLNYQDEDGAGTGMVLTSDGLVLTNNHVIEGETSISVTDVGNGKTYSATVVGYDRTDDVALLQLKDASGLTTVRLGNSSSVKVGEEIVGIGNAGGAGGTPSAAGGAVTGLDRSINASDEGNGTTETLHNLIETDANIESGDSGGPLVTTQGKVIGMDTAASGNGDFSIEGSSSSQGYSIPINEAISLAEKIEAHDASSTIHIGATAFLGVTVESTSSSDNGGYDYGGYGYGDYGYPGGSSPSTTSGAVVEQVFSGTPAATANLSAGDVITSIDGQAVTSPAGLTDDIVALKAGATVKLGYVNTSGQSETVTVTLTSGPPQ